MARNFNGTSDKILMSLGNVPTTITAFSFAAIVRRNATGAWHNIITLATSGDVTVVDMTIENVNNLYVEPYTNSVRTVTTIAAEWQLLVVTKPAGTALVRGHRYKYSTNAFTHTDSSATQTNPSGTVARVYLGTFATGDFFAGDIEIVGMWDRALSDAEIENLPFTMQAWLAANPKALWKLDQSATSQKIVDLVGGANESTLTGTTVAAASTPVFNYTDGIWIPTIVKPAAFNTYTKAGSLLASVLASGADSFNPSETGSLTTKGNPSAADAATLGRAGSLLAAALESGGDSFNPAEAGSLLAGTILSGPDVFSPSETGVLLVGAFESGADVSAFAETGSLRAQALSSGADARDAIETGSILAALLLSGADATQASETGSLALSGLLSGADAAAFAEAGTIRAGALLSGAGSKTKDKAGSLTVGAFLSGADAIAYTETGALLIRTFGSAADAAIVSRTGFLVAGGRIFGADAYTAVESGSLLALGNLSGAKLSEFAKSGSLTIKLSLSGVLEKLTGTFLTGAEFHWLTSAKVEDGRLVSATPEESVLVVLLPEKGKLTKVDI